jgi:hypothetical protein
MNAGGCNCAWPKRKAPHTGEGGGVEFAWLLQCGVARFKEQFCSQSLEQARRDHLRSYPRSSATAIAGAIIAHLAGDAAADAVVRTDVDRRRVSLADRSEIDARQTNAYDSPRQDRQTEIGVWLTFNADQNATGLVRDG